MITTMPTVTSNINLENKFSEKIKLYTAIEEGLAQVNLGNIKQMKETIKSIRTKIN